MNQPVRSKKRRRRWVMPLLIVCVLGGLIFWATIPVSKPAVVPTVQWSLRHIPVIDAGHGGEDGGAFAEDGTREADINLQVAKKLDTLMRFYGLPTVMLRAEDVSLHDASADSLREKKRSDLKNRVKMVEEIDDAVLLSVHQNTFTSPQYFGLQAFFGKAFGSRELAELVQQTTKTQLDTGNTRKAATVRKDVFLMNSVTCPAVLVECGFLTNTGEFRRLKDDDYQKKLAATITSSYIQWELGGQSSAPAEN